MSLAKSYKSYRTYEIEAAIGTIRYSLLDETLKANNQGGGKAEGCQLSVFCVREGYRRSARFTNQNDH